MVSALTTLLSVICGFHSLPTEVLNIDQETSLLAPEGPQPLKRDTLGSLHQHLLGKLRTSTPASQGCENFNYRSFCFEGGFRWFLLIFSSYTFLHPPWLNFCICSWQNKFQFHASKFASVTVYLIIAHMLIQSGNKYNFFSAYEIKWWGRNNKNDLVSDSWSCYILNQVHLSEKLKQRNKMSKDDVRENKWLLANIIQIECKWLGTF